MTHRQLNDPAQADDELDRTILGLLLQGGPSPLWGIEEVAREIGDRAAVEDGLAR